MKEYKKDDPDGNAFYNKSGDTIKVFGMGSCEILPDGKLRNTFNTKDHDAQISACAIDVRMAVQASLLACSGHPSKKFELISSGSPVSQKFKSQDLKEMSLMATKEGLDEDA